MQDRLPTSIWSFLPLKMSRLPSVIPINQKHNYRDEHFNFSASEIGRFNAPHCTIFLFSCVYIQMCLLNLLAPELFFFNFSTSCI